jgi:acyl-CoA thioester hydrolase
MSASAVCRARVGWSDTDAGGHHHHASITRFVEEAEAQLYRAIGDPGLMGLVPRVEYHAEFLGRLYYQDEIEVTLTVAKIGRTSLTYEFEVRRRAHRRGVPAVRSLAGRPADGAVRRVGNARRSRRA